MWKRYSVTIVVALCLLLGTFAGPASAGYREGQIGCQTGWVKLTTSFSGTPTSHEHYMETHGIEYHYNSPLAVTLWPGRLKRGSWSVKATPLHAGGASCVRIGT